jgi:hypothetical protein
MNTSNKEDTLLEIKDFREIHDLKRIFNLDDLNIDENYLIIRLFPINNKITEFIGPLISITNNYINFKIYWNRYLKNDEYTDWIKSEPGTTFGWTLKGFTNYPYELAIYSLGSIGKYVNINNGPNEIIHKLNNEPQTLQYLAFKVISDKDKTELTSVTNIHSSNIPVFKNENIEKGGTIYIKKKEKGIQEKQGKQGKQGKPVKEGKQGNTEYNF